MIAVKRSVRRTLHFTFYEMFTIILHMRHSFFNNYIKKCKLDGAIRELSKKVYMQTTHPRCTVARSNTIDAKRITNDICSYIAC